MFLCEFWEIFKNTFFHRTFAKDTILSSFFLGLNEEGSNLNHGNNVETALNSELPIVAEIALSTENPFHIHYNLYHEFFTPCISSTDSISFFAQ